MQFADVAGPVVIRESFHHVIGDMVNLLSQPVGEFLHEVSNQQLNILSSFAQGRKRYGKDIQPVVKIGAKLALLDHAPQILIRCRDHAHIHLDALVAAQAFEPLFLKNAEELRLEFERHIPDFVEKQRAAIGKLKTPRPWSQSSGESTPFVPEKFALDQRRGNRGAVYSHKGVAPARAGIVNGLRDHLFAGARLSANEDGAVHRRHHVYVVKYSPESGAGSN